MRDVEDTQYGELGTDRYVVVCFFFFSGDVFLLNNQSRITGRRRIGCQ
jgi:hypothetical protein